MIHGIGKIYITQYRTIHEKKNGKCFDVAGSIGKCREMFLSVQLASGACRNARVLLLTPPELGARSSRTWRCPKSYQYCNILYFINVVRLCQNFTQNVSFFGPEDENFAENKVPPFCS